jgi:hypothetical protein
MDDDSLTNFIVSMNRRFRRSQLLFDKSIKLRFYSAVECCLSYFKTLGVLKRSAPWKFGVKDILWAIGVHEASAADEPIAGESRTGGVVNFIFIFNQKSAMIFNLSRQDDPNQSHVFAVLPLIQKIKQHDLYQHIQSIAGLRIFMECHVFAVWDFMCLLKELYSRIVTTRAPWLPPKDLYSAHLINRILLEEETDRNPSIVQLYFVLKAKLWILSMKY